MNIFSAKIQISYFKFFWSNSNFGRISEFFFRFFCRISRDLFSYTTRAKVHFSAWLVHIILHHCFREFPYQPNNFLAAALCLPRVCVWSKTVTKVIRYAKTGVTSFEKTRCWLIVAKKLGPTHLFFPKQIRDFSQFSYFRRFNHFDVLRYFTVLYFYGFFTVFIWIRVFTVFAFRRIFRVFLNLMFYHFYQFRIFGGFFSCFSICSPFLVFSFWRFFDFRTLRIFSGYFFAKKNKVLFFFCQIILSDIS